MNAGVLIVGASHAGFQLAASLRERGYQDAITLVGDELYAPYQRPPLSKGILLGLSSTDSLMFRGPDFYRDNRITLALSERIVQVDRDRRRATGATGRQFDYDYLALTVGAAARKLSLPGSELSGVVTLRSIDDAKVVKAEFDAARHVVVIGGGFIGLECAAVARALGKSVVVLEAMDRLLARSVAAPVSKFFADAHRRRGIDIVLEARVEALEGEGGRVRAVRLQDGSSCPADVVVTGIGGVPRTELAQSMGLELGDGILVDAYANTSVPGILAAGDCTVHRSLYNRRLRLESVQNALDQAKVAAATIMNEKESYRAIPWFWSEQGDLKLQIAGISSGHDAATLRGSFEDEKFSLLYYRQDQLVAVDSVNRPADHLAARRLLETSTSVPPELGCETSIPLKSFLPNVATSKV